MSSQASAAPSSSEQDIKRSTAGYHPSIWGDHFFKYSSLSLANDAKILQELEALKQEIRMMLISTFGYTFERLCLIDAVQRLGVAYHFEKEIEDALEKLYHESCDDDNNLQTTALRFRLLRQQGYYVPCDGFDKFKNDQGKFKASLINDVPAMLCLYEAAYLGIPGEDILDEAISFTTFHLGSMVDQVSPQLAEQINHALNRPLRKCLPRLEARYYINVFSGDDSQNQTLLKFAKLDFGMLQVQHRKEISSIIEWWKNLDFARKLPYARDRVVECYFWILGVYFEPQYALARRILTKVIKMLSIIDDTYDAYGTYEELEVFTDAIQRWEVSTIEVLPEYMKHIYQALLDVYCEVEREISKEGRSYCTHYAIEAIKRLVRAFLVEAKWCNKGYVPKLEEYMQNSLESCGYPTLATNSFLGMGEIADNHAFEWISNDPPIVKASTIICRLMDDIVSNEFEQKRKHVASGIECYQKEHNVSREEVVKQFRKEISNAWKDINREFLKPTAVQMPLLMPILNFSRVVDVIYKDDDGYTNCHLLKDYITSLLIDPVHV